MIGVSLCSDPVVTTDDNYANNSSILNQSHVIAGSSSMVPLKNQMNHSVVATGGGVLNDHSVTTLNSSLGGSYLNRSSIRPLTQAYKAANADADVRMISFLNNAKLVLNWRHGANRIYTNAGF